MTFRIEKGLEGDKTRIRLIGQIQSQHLDQLRAQLTGLAQRLVLDLDEVVLVDADVVRFLGRCQKQGAELRHCPPYVREWILREERQQRASTVDARQ